MPNRGNAAPTGQTLTALIVDDEALARDELAYLLKDFPDVEVTASASNGLEAIELIEDIEPDLVFLDVQMPGLDGIGVIRRLREKDALRCDRIRRRAELQKLLQRFNKTTAAPQAQSGQGGLHDSNPSPVHARRGGAARAGPAFGRARAGAEPAGRRAGRPFGRCATGPRCSIMRVWMSRLPSTA